MARELTTVGGSADETLVIDDLLDRAVDAINHGHFEIARQLAQEVLATDGGNDDAEVILANRPDDGTGELRRPTIMFCDLVGSTALSTRHDPEMYRRVVGRYKSVCRTIIEGTYDGQIVSIKGDGLLALFGYPSGHDDDARRAVHAGLDIVDAMHELSAHTEREIGESLSARVGLHKGLVYIDHDEDEVYGLAANVAARIHELAEPGTVVVSGSVVPLLGQRFDTIARDPRTVKGIDTPLPSWQVCGERRLPTFRGEGRLLTGRQDELERVRSAWAARPGAVLLTGEAGIGKSYLVGAAARELADSGVKVIAVQGSSVHSSVPLHAVRTLLEEQCRIGRGVGAAERLGLLRRHLNHEHLDDALLPSLAAVLGLDPSAGYSALESDGRKLHEQVMSAVADYLHAMIAGPAVLLVVEDAHWLDEHTAQLMATITHHRPDGTLVLMTSRRPSPPPGCIADVVEVGPIAEATALELIVALDPDGITVPNRDAILSRGDGVPLYIEELVRAALDAAIDRTAHGVAGAAATTSGVPDVLYEPLLARLDAVAGAAAVAGTAAVIGSSFDRRVLADVLDIDAGEQQAGLDALVAGGIIELSMPGDDDRFRFRHELLRDVAYELQPASVRQSLHGRVADALERWFAASGSADWLALAHHNEMAKRPGQAIDCYERSADEARRLGSLAVTTDRLSRAIGLVGDLPDGRARTGREINLRLARAFVAASTEGNASATVANDYARCLQLTIGDCSADDIWRALIPMWGYYTSRGDLAHADEVLTALRAVVVQSDDWTLVENTAGFAMLDWFCGRFTEAREPLETAVRGARSRGPDDRSWYMPNDPRTSIQTHLGLARFAAGDLQGAAHAFAASTELCSALSYPQDSYSLAYNLAYASWTLMHLGEFGESASTIATTLQLAEEHGFDFWTIAGGTQRIATEVYRAGWDDCADAGACADWAAQLGGLVALWQMVGVRLFLPSILTTQALAHLGAGDRVECRRSLDAAEAVATETGAHFCDAETMRVRALAADEPNDAAALLDRAAATAARQGMVPFQLRIAIEKHRLDARRGRVGLDAALALFVDGSSCALLDRARDLAAASLA